MLAAFIIVAHMDANISAFCFPENVEHMSKPSLLITDASIPVFLRSYTIPSIISFLDM